MKIRCFISIAVLCIILFPLYSFAGDDGPDDQSVPAVADKAPTAGVPSEEIQEEGGIADPLESWNRLMFTFNDKLYFWLLKPTAKVYNTFIPEWGRIRVRNVVHNVAMPVRFVNSVLQLKFHAAVGELGRFVANTVGGLGGMFEIVKDNPQSGTSDRDFGQTLGKYGIPDGFYIVWPFLGPSSFRDSIGLAGDYFLTPENYITPFLDSVEVQGHEKVNDVSLRIGDYEDFKKFALDPYVAMKDAYYQYRKGKVKEQSFTGPLYREEERP